MFSIHMGLFSLIYPVICLYIHGLSIMLSCFLLLFIYRTRQTDRQTQGQTDREAGWHTDREAGKQESKQTVGSSWAEGDVGAGVRPQPVIYNLSAQLGQDPADRVGEDWQIRRFGRHFEYWFSSLWLRVCLGFSPPPPPPPWLLPSIHPFPHSTFKQNKFTQVGRRALPSLLLFDVPHLPCTLTHSFTHSLTHSLSAHHLYLPPSHYSFPPPSLPPSHYPSPPSSLTLSSSSIHASIHIHLLLPSIVWNIFKRNCRSARQYNECSMLAVIIKMVK